MTKTGYIAIKNAQENNLKNVSLQIPLGKLVAVVGKSGSGKSSLVYDVIFRFSQREKVKAIVENLPPVQVVPQKVKPAPHKSLGQTNLAILKKAIQESAKENLLIVDEPCAGLGAKDRKNVLTLLRDTLKKGVSIIVVEHNKDIIVGSDYVIEFGPLAGSQGGKVIFEGTIEQFRKAKTSTAQYAFSNRAEKVDYKRRPSDRAQKMQLHSLSIKGITKNNLKNYSLTFPLGSLVSIIGGIGTGKTTLLEVAYGCLFKGKNAWKYRTGFKSVEGKTHVRRSFIVDQSPLSNIVTSTPATYLGVWDVIRTVYGSLSESKKKRLNKSHFSFNTKAGKEKQEQLKGIKYQGVSIFDLLDFTIDDAVKLFGNYPLVIRKLGFLQEVGLGYLTLGQRSNTLSGGEAQRVRLAKILSKKLGDRCIYMLDTPSRGLHLTDLPVLVKVLQKIIDKNNTVLMAENREELINNSDYVINLSKK